MSGQPPRKPLPAWHGGTDPGQPRGKQPSRRSTTGALPSGKRKKLIALGLVSAAFGLTVAGIIIVILLLRNPTELSLVLLEAGYEKNLAVPHNAFGRFGLQQLAVWGEKHNSDSQRLAAHPPETFTTAKG